jgi:hypothetical protein
MATAQLALRQTMHDTRLEEERRMYQIVVTHEIMPGKTPELIKWVQGGWDEARKKDPKLKVPGDPDYRGSQRQFITVYGSAYQFVFEAKVDKIPEEPYALAGNKGALLPLLVPGRTTIQVLKLLEFK